jgi:hypothetical protein
VNCMRCTTRQAYVGARTPRGRTVWLCQLCAGEVLEQTWAHLDGALLHRTMEVSGLPGVDRLDVKGGLPGAD